MRGENWEETKKLLRGFGHVMRIGEERIPKKMLHVKIEGKRLAGRPKTRSINQIGKDIELRGDN